MTARPGINGCIGCDERQACPRCDDQNYETTCMGGLDLDVNRCHCRCGWSGRGWEMTPSGRAEASRRGMLLSDDVRDTIASQKGD